MKKQKMQSGLVVAVAVACSTMVQANDIELRGAGIFYSPGGAAATGGGDTAIESVNWDRGAGAEAQGILWFDRSPFGVGILVGTSKWDIEPYELFTGGHGSPAFGDMLEGDVNMISFGTSVLWSLFPRTEDKGPLRGLFEVGTKVISLDSNISGVTGVAAGGPVLTWEQTLELESGLVGFVAFDLSLELTQTLYLFVQGGVQFDLIQGEAINDVQDLGTFSAGETELGAGYGKVGFSVQL